jgi:signal transduction histidine kinase
VEPRRSLFWPLQLGGWAVFYVGMLVAGFSQWPVAYTLVNKTSLVALGFFLTLVLRAVFRALDARGAGLPVQAVLAVPLSWGLAAVWMATHHLVLRAFTERGAVFGGFPDFTNAIYFAFVLFSWSALYFGVSAHLARLEADRRLSEAEALANEARLNALRLQLNPHFLFNTLNGVSTLVAEGKGEEATKMLARLADFLRATLDVDERHEVPLSEELSFAKSYLEIERSRFGERLRVDVDVDGAANDGLVPALILQPLVENAVKHAVAPRAGHGTVSIAARAADGELTLRVDDDGPGLAEPARGGIGLSNTKERLRRLYGDRALLTLGTSASGGLGVSIRLPFRATTTVGARA